MLPQMRPGGWIVWHDFAPELAPAYPWIDAVCEGVDALYRRGCLSAPVYHLRDSWMGLYQVPDHAQNLAGKDSKT